MEETERGRQTAVCRTRHGRSTAPRQRDASVPCKKGSTDAIAPPEAIQLSGEQCMGEVLQRAREEEQEEQEGESTAHIEPQEKEIRRRLPVVVFTSHMIGR